MEKVIITLRGAEADDAWCERLRDDVATELLDLGVPGLAINGRDEPVRDSLMTLTTLDPAVVALVLIAACATFYPAQDALDSDEIMSPSATLSEIRDRLSKLCQALESQNRTGQSAAARWRKGYWAANTVWTTVPVGSAR